MEQKKHPKKLALFAAEINKDIGIIIQPYVGRPKAVFQLLYHVPIQIRMSERYNLEVPEIYWYNRICKTD